MKKTVKIISVLMALAIALCVMPTGFAKEGDKGSFGDFEYETRDEFIVITRCDKGVEKVEIPEKINEKFVFAIGEYAFSRCTQLTEVVVPNSVIQIEKYAFFCCENPFHRSPLQVLSLILSQVFYSNIFLIFDLRFQVQQLFFVIQSTGNFFQ